VRRRSSAASARAAQRCKSTIEELGACCTRAAGCAQQPLRWRLLTVVRACHARFTYSCCARKTSLPTAGAERGRVAGADECSCRTRSNKRYDGAAGGDASSCSRTLIPESCMFDVPAMLARAPSAALTHRAACSAAPRVRAHARSGRRGGAWGALGFLVACCVRAVPLVFAHAAWPAAGAAPRPARSARECITRARRGSAWACAHRTAAPPASAQFLSVLTFPSAPARTRADRRPAQCQRAWCALRRRARALLSHCSDRLRLALALRRSRSPSLRRSPRHAGCARRRRCVTAARKGTRRMCRLPVPQRAPRTMR
jgi:hypothetical protein